MNIQFFILFAVFLLSDILIFILFYRIFIKYRYNYFFKIKLEEMHNIDDTKFVASAKVVDIIYSTILIIALDLLEYFFQRYLLFYDQDTYLYFRYMPIMGYIGYWFAFFVGSSIITSYVMHRDNFEKFLYWECFLYKGKKQKLFYDNPEFRTPYIREVKKSDIITQAETEKKSFKIFLVICALFLILQFAVPFQINCFKEDEILISYSKYDYDDITAIYKASKFQPLIGSVIYGDYVTLVFNDGRKWDDRNKDRVSPELLDIIVQKSGVNAVECEFLPNNL